MSVKFPTIASEEEQNVIKALPSNFVSVSKPSKVINRLLSKRQREHESSIKLMKNSFQSINKKVSEEIRLESDIFKRQIFRLRLDVQNFLKVSIISPSQTDFNNHFDSMIEKLNEYNQTRHEYIQYFNKALKSLERNRSEEFKLILTSTYRKLFKIYYKLPLELELFFQEEIVRLNEITMNNFLCYTQLINKFQVQAEEDMRIWLLEVTENRNSYKVAVKRTTIINLVMDTKQSKSELLSSQLESRTSSMPITFKDPLETTDVDQWCNQTQETLETLDINARKLVDLYKSTVSNVFNRFFTELQKVTDVLAEDMDNETSDISYMNTEVYKPIIEDITQNYACEIKDLQELWNSITVYMQSNIRDTYFFLKASSHLWDDHFKRIVEAQNLVLRDLKVVMDKHDKEVQEYEKKMNTVFDNLRQESTVAKLDKQLQNVNKILDTVGDMYESQCQEELKILEKYRVLNDKEVGLLLSEIGRFLSEHPQDEELDPKVLRKRASRLSSTDTDDALIPYQMKACQYQVNAVKNWMFGLWEAIKSYMQTCRAELTNKANDWIDKHIEKLRKRLEVKMSVHKPRYMRTKIVLYDTRLSEIQDHLQQLTNLEERNAEKFMEAKANSDKTREKQKKILNEYQEEISKLESKIPKAIRQQHLLADIDILSEVTKRKEDEIYQVAIENEDFINRTMNAIKCMNCKFTKSVKLFSNGGNFSSDESKTIHKKITKLNNVIPKKTTPLLNEANNIKTETLSILRSMQHDLKSKLNHITSEYKQKEKATLQIKNLQHIIRRSVYNLKFKFKRMEAYTDYLKDLLQVNMGRCDNFELIERSYEETLEKVAEFSKFLFGMIEEQKKETLFEINKKRMSTKQSQVNFLHQIYKHEPSSTDESYLGHLNIEISHSLKEIQSTAKKFYSNHGEIMTVNKLPPSYENFMEEVIRHFKSYRCQCEISWLECVQDLILALVDLLQNLDKFHVDTITRYLRNQITMFKELKSRTLKTMQEEEKILENEYLKVLPQLKEYYGNFKTKYDMNEKLGEEMFTIKIQNEEYFDNLMVTNKTTLSSASKSIKEETTHLHDFVRNIEGKEDFLNILQQAMHHFDAKLYIIENLVTDSKSKKHTTKAINSINYASDEDDQSRCSKNENASFRKVSLLKSFLESLPSVNLKKQEADSGEFHRFIEKKLDIICEEYREALEEMENMKKNICSAYNDITKTIQTTGS